MLSRVLSMGLLGIDGYPVTVEVDISFGMPLFDMVCYISLRHISLSAS